ncbi:MAG: DUF4265 domain-containing protein [Myxococcota bacterium]
MCIPILVADGNPPGPEMVPAEPVGESSWRLLRSPLYALGVVSGDVVRILDDAMGVHEVISRGGNVGVQFYLDGLTAGLAMFTLPLPKKGFEALGDLLDAVAIARPGSEWQYTNVFDARDEPLGWW